MRGLLVKTRDIKKASYFWNMAAYTGSSFQSMLLMLVISRRGNAADTAIVSIAFTVASMLLLVGKYAIRNYQVSDTKAEYTYGDYTRARNVTMLWMCIASAVYLAFCFFYKEYSAEKTICVILIAAVRFLEAAEDSLHADFQRHGRLDIAAKIWAVRIWAYIISFAVLYLITDKLPAAAAGSLVVAVILFIVLNYAVYDFFPKDNSYDRTRIRGIIKNCFPLAASTLTTAYIASATKYTVDAVFTSEAQACFNIVCMPVFVITLLSNYIYNPIIKSMAELWNVGHIGKMKRMIWKQVFVLTVFTGIVVLCGEWFGVRFLEIVYKVELDQYRIEFALLMIAGDAIAIFSFLTMISTVIRRQKMLIYVSLAASLVLIAGNKAILLRYGVRSMCLFYALTVAGMALLTLVFAIRYINYGNRGEVNDTE